MDMKGKVALITGGTSGIGRSAAVLFAHAGAKVVVTGRREAEGKETVSLIERAGSQGMFIRADVTKESDCKHMVDEVMNKFGRLDYAFNNAGYEGALAPLTEQSVDNFQATFNVNVLGVFLSMKYQIPAMRKSGAGAIVNNASVAGVIGMAGGSPYIASKHAVLGMTKCAALECAKENIRVNAVSPAAIETEMYERFTGNDDQTKQHLAAMHPVGRIGKPDEVASAVVFLCSPGASFITGANLMADGGFTVQ